MKRIALFSVLGIGCLFLFSQCFNKAQATEQKKDPSLVTHKEAVDTLRADSTAPIKALVYKKMTNVESYDFYKNHDLSSLFKGDYPNHGFYGADRYHIEFIFTEVKKDSLNANMYHIKGKNRHKKVITPFEGTFRITDLVEFEDPNLDTANLNSMNVLKIFAAKGVFELNEDPAMPETSGRFTGTFATEFSESKDHKAELWYYSDGTASKGSGYRFDGTWSMYKNPAFTNSVVWAQDFFRFANDILKDFSIGERDVEINPQYRHLGWDNFWDGEEWWVESKTKKEL